MVKSFARTFSDSRQQFIAAAEGIGAALTTYAHPLRGPEDEPLSCDVARLGAGDPDMLLVLITGVHGVEHYPGSASVCDWLERSAVNGLPDGIGAVVVHAINPWGAAWSRRYTEDNVDLARNFLDFDDPLPAHPPYEEVEPILRHMEGDEAQEVIEMLFARFGERETIDALMSGQYDYPKGFSFGGHAPTWSRQTIERILAKEAGSAERICLVEFHSGLGPWGEVMPVSMQTGSDLDRVRCYYGDNIIAPRIEKGSHGAPGHTTDGYLRLLGDREVASIVLEFGTYPPSKSLPVLLADHWVHSNGRALTEFGRKIAADNLEMHCPSGVDWQSEVLRKGAEFIAASIRGLQQCH